MNKLFLPTAFNNFAKLLSSDFDFQTAFNSDMKTNIKETPEKYILSCEIPGVSKDNIELDFKNGVLTISTKFNKEDELKDGEKFVHYERVYSQKTRQFYFENIDENNIKAQYQDGILQLDLLKRQSTDKSKIVIE